MITIEDLTEGQRDELLGRAIERPQKQGRRIEFHARWLAMTEQQESLVKQRIQEVFHQTDVIAEMTRFSRSIYNPLRRITGKIAVAYKSAPRRRLEGASEETSKRFSRLLRQLSFNVKAQTWNRLQVGMNTVVILVVPKRRHDGIGVPAFEVIHGGAGEVFLDPDAPFEDTPAVLSYPVPPTWADDTPPDQREVAATVDGRWWVFWNDQREVVRVVEHNMGEFPGVALRGTDPLVRDVDGWWDHLSGRSVTQTVAEVGMAAATMGWTRKSQFANLIAVLRSPEDRAPGPDEDDGEDNALGHPESALDLVGEDIRLLVNDLDKGIENFRAHIRYLTEETAEVMTGASSALVDPEPGQPVADLAEAQKHAALRECQERQVAGLVNFEHDLLPKVSRMATLLGNPFALSPAEVRERLEVEFAPLPFLDTPEQRLRYYILATKFGVADQVDWMVEHTGLTEQEALERILAKAKERAQLHKILAQHQTPNDETGASCGRDELPGETLAQRQGRAGGAAELDSGSRA